MTGTADANASATLSYTALRAEYEHLFATCVPSKLASLHVAAPVLVMFRNRSRYQSVSDSLRPGAVDVSSPHTPTLGVTSGASLGIPWWWIAVVHQLESSGRFDRHLHNGDLLTSRTVQVPPGRPPTGDPPFTWEESAADALRLHHLDSWHDWSHAGALYQWELYNGMGYRKVRGQGHGPIHSPYLWAGSNHYTKGKFVSDGHYDPEAVSKQIGAGVFLRYMADHGLTG